MKLKSISDEGIRRIAYGSSPSDPYVLDNLQQHIALLNEVYRMLSEDRLSEGGRAEIEDEMDAFFMNNQDAFERMDSWL